MPAETSATGQHAVEKEPGTQDIGQASDQLPIVPVPFIVVDKVPDQTQPDYGDVEPETLPVDNAKRAADADADYESIQPETADETQQQVEPAQVPVVVVEKSDDKPAFGEDFGEDATLAQKLAHELRAADAAPDKVVVKGESHNGLDDLHIGLGELGNSPLLSHENGEATQTNDGDELDNAPLMSHETGPSSKSKDASEDTSELGKALLLSHETGFSSETRSSSEINELNVAPLMSHEDPFSDKNEDRSDGKSKTGSIKSMSYKLILL